MARRALKLREGIAPVWDRLLAMGFLAALLHGLVILGITFNTSAGEKSAAPGLEVLLTSEELPTAKKNPTATYLAQRTQLGSGNTREPRYQRFLAGLEDRNLSKPFDINQLTRLVRRKLGHATE